MQKSLMQQGFESLVSPKEQFAKEQKFGIKVLYLAWAVEVVAVMVGLLTAWFNGYAAYEQFPEKDLSAKMEFLLGALPFIVVAIVELSKIPLAAGFYKVKKTGWRVLILIALLSLMFVTFETISLGLERQATNITSSITAIDTKIKDLEKEQSFIQKKLETSDEELSNKENDATKRKQEIISQYEIKINGIEELISQERSQLNNLNSTSGNEANESDLARKRQDIEDIKKELLTIDKAETLIALKEEQQQKRASIAKLKKESAAALKSLRNERDSKIDAEYQVMKNVVDAENSKFFTDKTKIKAAEEAFEQEKKNITNDYASLMVDPNEVQIVQLDDRVKELDTEITKEQTRLENKRVEVSKKLEVKEGIYKTSLAKINEGSEKAKADIQARINNLQNDLTNTKNNRDKEIERKDKELITLANQQSQALSSIKTATGEIKNPQARLVEIGLEKTKLEGQKRQKAEKSQIHRLAHMYYGPEDIVDLTSDQVNMVKTVWFGSIALIVSSIGSILALIAYILMDPEAFEQRNWSSLSKRISRLSYVLTGRIIKIAFALAELIKSIAGSLLAMAQIFKGAVGKPLQRSIRSTLVTFRKRLKQPKIVEVIKEVEVEKIVEREVPVEVEKVVEKEVIKEVPVEKIVFKEVPKEVIRKELIYVPLYSTDSGLIDSKKSALSSKLFSGELNETKIKDAESNNG